MDKPKFESGSGKRYVSSLKHSEWLMFSYYWGLSLLWLYFVDGFFSIFLILISVCFYTNLYSYQIKFSDQHCYKLYIGMTADMFHFIWWNVHFDT